MGPYHLAFSHVGTMFCANLIAALCNLRRALPPADCSCSSGDGAKATTGSTAQTIVE